MKVTIKSQHKRVPDRPYSKVSKKIVVYLAGGDRTKNPVEVIHHEFYNPQEIYTLKFKSKAWSSAARAANSLINKALKNKFPGYKSHFDYRAGCSCGCSSGYILTKIDDRADDSLKSSDIWVNVEADDQELKDLRSKIEKLEPILEDEIKHHTKE